MSEPPSDGRSVARVGGIESQARSQVLSTSQSAARTAFAAHRPGPSRCFRCCSSSNSRLDAVLEICVNMIETICSSSDMFASWKTSLMRAHQHTMYTARLCNRHQGSRSELQAGGRTDPPANQNRTLAELSCSKFMCFSNLSATKGSPVAVNVKFEVGYGLRNTFGPMK